MSLRLVLASLLACCVWMSVRAQNFAVGSLEQSYDGWEVVPWAASHVDVTAFVEEYNGNGAYFPSLMIDPSNYNHNCCFQTQFNGSYIYPYNTCAKWRAGYCFRPNCAHAAMLCFAGLCRVHAFVPGGNMLCKFSFPANQPISLGTGGKWFNELSVDQVTPVTLNLCTLAFFQQTSVQCPANCDGHGVCNTQTGVCNCTGGT